MSTSATYTPKERAIASSQNQNDKSMMTDGKRHTRMHTSNHSHTPPRTATHRHTQPHTATHSHTPSGLSMGMTCRTT